MYNLHKMENSKWDIPENYKKIYSRGLTGKHINTPENVKYVTQLRNNFSRLSEETYEDCFHNLLWFEEIKERECLQEQNVDRIRLHKTSKINTFNIFVKGLERKQRYIRIDDSLLLLSRLDSTKLYASIGDISVTKDILTITVKKPSNFRVRSDEEYKLVFLFSNHQYVSMHNAVDRILKGKHYMKVFPKNKITCNKTKPIITWFDPKIATNAEQRRAVEHIVARSSGSAPYILHGPPGTGKTATIVEAILQVLRLDPSHKVMVCAPSNSAADDVACKLIKYEDKFPIDIFLSRRNSSKRDWSTLPKCLNRYSHGKKTKTSESSKTITSDALIKPELTRTRIIVSTICYAPQAVRKLPFITHLFIDEAAQATEPLCLVPIHSLLVPDGLLVLSGDPLQLGPVLSSPQAKEYGLGTSLMERLMKSDLYSSVKNDPNYTVMLKKNFRSHADILHIPNKQFYNGQLEACAREDVISKRNVLNEGHRGRAIAFHAVFGQEAQENQSSSYFNEKELNMLKLYIKKIIYGEHREKAENIGIITPYTAQVNKIKEWLGKQGLDAVEVGSVEAYQGREKKIILMSTVRGQGADVKKKVKLGFLKDSKRFNVALTRAKAKLIVIGNPHSLKKDKLWQIYIETCKDIGSYDVRDVRDYLENEKMLKMTSTMRKLRV